MLFYGICKVFWEFNEAKKNGNEKAKGELQIMIWEFVLILIIIFLIWLFSAPYRG